MGKCRGHCEGGKERDSGLGTRDTGYGIRATVDACGTPGSGLELRGLASFILNRLAAHLVEKIFSSSRSQPPITMWGSVGGTARGEKNGIRDSGLRCWFILPGGHRAIEVLARHLRSSLFTWTPQKGGAGSGIRGSGHWRFPCPSRDSCWRAPFSRGSASSIRF